MYSDSRRALSAASWPWWLMFSQCFSVFAPPPNGGPASTAVLTPPNFDPSMHWVLVDPVEKWGRPQGGIQGMGRQESMRRHHLKLCIVSCIQTIRIKNTLADPGESFGGGQNIVLGGAKSRKNRKKHRILKKNGQKSVVLGGQKILFRALGGPWPPGPPWIRQCWSPI